MELSEGNVLCLGLGGSYMGVCISKKSLRCKLKICAFYYMLIIP